MGWWIDLFSKKDKWAETEYHPEFNLPEINNTLPMPEVMQPKPEKDISEPVLAIVKAMKERPSSFKMVDKNIGHGDHHSEDTYTIKDVKTNQTLIVKHHFYYYGNFKGEYSYSWKWLTKDEGDLLVKEFLEMNKIKSKRKASIERAAMKAIYK